ncbi:ATP-binding protein [Brevibacterium paucivorans]|uniref:ATP-binding protein n=1 Tax=Brevibacterium paucivorans TaxID=170994 RepID=UPI0032196B4D
MSEGLFSAVEVEATGKPGYRLERIELCNWGTFDNHVSYLYPNGETALLTGDIGSGKSTIVDAVSTLLLPSHTIEYNKAAGAGRRERSLRSYVEGHYKSERDEQTGTSRPVALRGHNAYSVILGTFTNEGYDETVTLAQVFQQRDSTGQPWRRFFSAPKRLTILDDFSDFGTDINNLLRNLRKKDVAIDDTFPSYARRIRRLLGIRSEQAMDLFQQTVSMKAVGDLNEFVRTHMLEPTEADDRIRKIIDHFDDLENAYQAVQRAQQQLELLTPLVENANKYDAVLARQDSLAKQHDAVAEFFADKRAGLRTEKIEQLEAELATVNQQLTAKRETRDKLSAERDGLIAARASAGGERLETLRHEAKSAREQQQQRQARNQRMQVKLQDAGLPEVATQADFNQVPGKAQDQLAVLEPEAAALDEKRSTIDAGRMLLTEQERETKSELESLVARRNNLPSHLLDIREQLSAATGISEDELPFAGELLDVAEEFEEWRGAAERVLRNFALSMLVPQAHYPAVAEWVNTTRLQATGRGGRPTGVRLVYERVPDQHVPLQRKPSAGLRLADTIEIEDSPFRTYLKREVESRADHLCAKSVEEFRGAQRAVTREGQVRSRDRHEKDDRRRVDDPRAWVLGRVSARKQEALLREIQEQYQRQSQLNEARERLVARQTQVQTQSEALRAVLDFDSWDEVDWESARARVQAAEAEIKRLESGSSELAEITRRFESVEQQIKDNDAALTEVNRQATTLEVRLGQERSALERDREILAADTFEKAQESFEDLQARVPKNITSVEQADKLQALTASAIAKDIESAQKEINGHTTTMLTQMGNVRERFPAETTEMDVNVGARNAYREFHARVKDDDLPRFKAEFKEQLNTNAIREIAGFSSWLRRQADEIDVRIGKINEALSAVDFNEGRYIRLEKSATINQDVRKFRSDLRDVTAEVGDDADSSLYSEQRFQDVRAIIERFKGREGHTDADKAWTVRVTDVRNWFTFSASERDRETDEEWEHFRDSDGKSGGQKEKLAYTILAASLAYQFDLKWGATKSRDFRFAVIDEAFGRGSDSSTRYALDLFRRLGLQLLIVTPLQKVHIIAPYVKSIGFVDNVGGDNSRLLTMTIEQYYNDTAGSGRGSNPGGLA